jgi:hypothetical protein
MDDRPYVIHWEIVDQKVRFRFEAQPLRWDMDRESRDEFIARTSAAFEEDLDRAFLDATQELRSRGTNG